MTTGFTRHRLESTPCQQSAGEFVIASVGGRRSAASRCYSYRLRHAFPSYACGSMRFEVSDVDRLLHRSSRNTICKCPTSVSASAQQPQRNDPIPVNPSSTPASEAAVSPAKNKSNVTVKDATLFQLATSQLEFFVSDTSSLFKSTSLVVDFNWHHPRILHETTKDALRTRMAVQEEHRS
jgi:hypothetical protein